MLTEAHEFLRQQVRAVARQQLAPRAAATDQSGQFPREQVKVLADLGYLGLPVPAEFGGGGADEVSLCVVIEELAAACFSTAGTLSAHWLALLPILLAADAAQKDRWLPALASGRRLAAFGLTEPQAGSDAILARTSAVPAGGDYVLEGRKVFCTNGGEADVYVVFCQVREGDGGLGAVLVEAGTPGFTFGRQETKMGMRGSATGELIFEGCRVPRANLICPPGAGVRVLLGTLNRTRYVVGAQGTGLATAALAAALDYARDRVQGGKPIVEHQLTQAKLADMAMDLQAARLLVYSAAWMADQGQTHVAESAMAKLYASEMACRVVDAAVQIHGGYGYMADYPVERLYRDARVLRIYEGTSEIQRLTIARQLMKSGVG